MEDNRIKPPIQFDVIIPTWNSNRTLAQSLKAIRDNIQPSRIIVVDRDSNDGTRETAEKFGCEIVTDTISLGSARMKGIREADTGWVAFIDDDVIIDKTFNHLFGYIDEKTGAVQGIPRWVRDGEVQKAFEADLGKMFSAHEVINLTKNMRGLTNVTVVRRDLLTDLDIADMNAYEDWVISRHILSKGYQWKIVDVKAAHILNEEITFKKACWNCAGMFNMWLTGRIGNTDLFMHYLRRLLGEYKSLLAQVESGDKRGDLARLAPFLGSLIGPAYYFTAKGWRMRHSQK